MWHPQTGRVLVAVTDARNGEHFEFDVEPSHALAAFRHP
jgi:hypothetical protein